MPAGRAGRRARTVIAANTTGAIAALAMRARRQVKAHFLAYHAVSPEEAVPYVPQRRLERTQFVRLLRRGVIREAKSEHYWLDLESDRREEERRRAILVPLVVALAVACAGLIVLLY